MGKLAKVLRIKVILPPLEMFCLFHNANLFWNLSSTPSQAATDLKEAPIAIPNKRRGDSQPYNQVLQPKPPHFPHIPLGLTNFYPN